MNAERKIDPIVVENAKLIFKNFQGKPNDYNAAGDRNFCLLLTDPDYTEDLRREGWNIRDKVRKLPDGTEEPYSYLKVKVKYGKVPPIVVLITSRGKTRLTEETIGQLDWARIKNVDLIVRPYIYPERNGRPSGVAAYLKSIYVTIQEDALEEKYGSIPETDGDEEIPFE